MNGHEIVIKTFQHKLIIILRDNKYYRAILQPIKNESYIFLLYTAELSGLAVSYRELLIWGMFEIAKWYILQTVGMLWKMQIVPKLQTIWIMKWMDNGWLWFLLNVEDKKSLTLLGLTMKFRHEWFLVQSWIPSPVQL